MTIFGWCKRIVFVLIVSLLLQPAAASPASAEENGGGRLVDEIAMGVEGSEEQHHVQTEGNSGNDTITEKIGQETQTYHTRYIGLEGSSLRYDANIEKGRPVTLEIQEIHKRQHQYINYDVYVNETKVYSRSYNVRGAGPNHYFVKINDEALLDNDRITVKFVNRYDGEVHFGHIWVYSDFDSLLAAEKVNRPLIVSILKPVSYGNYTSDLEKINQIKTTLKGNDRMIPGFGVQLRYAKWTKEEVQRQIDYILRLSHDSGLPVHIQFDTWWAGTPNGPDGQGGYWSDVRYQQVTYDPQTGYGLSIPNQWSSTPWLTMSSDHYNTFKQERLKEHLAYLSKRYHEMKAEGKQPVISGLIMDSEPAYWAVGMPGATPNQSADFNPGVIAAAERDGITLDPADGLTLEEKVWLLDHVTNYNILIADAMKEGLGIDPIIVSAEGTNAPERQLFAKIFSQGFDEVKFPFDNDVYRFWETALVNGANLGTEWTFVDARQSLEYQFAQGTAANTNLEASMLSQNFESVSLAYANGFDHVFVYNLAANQHAALQQTINQRGRIYSPKTYSLTLFEQNFKTNDYLQDAYAVDNVQVRTDWEWALSAKDTSKPGHIIYKVHNDGKKLGNLAVNYYARAINYHDSQDDTKKLKIYAGPDVDHLTLVHELSRSGPIRNSVDLREHATGKTELFVKFELDAAGLPEGLESWVGLQEVTFGVGGDVSGHTDPSVVVTEEEARTHHLWVSARKDAELLLAENKRSLKTDAYARAVYLFMQGRYVSAQNVIHQALSEDLPATFTVNGEGVLGSYPIALKLSDPAITLTAVLTEMKKDKISLSFSSEHGVMADITVGGLKDGDWYEIRKVKGNEIEIKKSAENKSEAVKVVNGRVTLIAEIQGEPPIKETSRTVTGDFRAYHQGNDTIHIRPDDPRFDRAEVAVIPLSEEVQVYRGQNAEALSPSSANQIRFGEQVTVTMDSTQNAKRIEALYGEKKFAIQEMHQMTPYEMARVTDQEGNSYTFDLDTVLKLRQQSGKMRDTAVGQIGLKPGDVVQLTYNPVTKRILEIQDSSLLLFEDYESPDHNAWKSRAYAYRNVKTDRIDENHPQRGLVPDDMSQTGEVTYKLTSQYESFADLGLSYKTRVIVGQLNVLRIYAGTNPEDLKLMAELKPEIGAVNQSRGLDLTEVARGHQDVYVKFEMKTEQFNSWTYLGEVGFREAFRLE